MQTQVLSGEVVSGMGHPGCHQTKSHETEESVRERGLRKGQGPGTGHLKGHQEEKPAREAEEELPVRREARRRWYLFQKPGEEEGASTPRKLLKSRVMRTEDRWLG